MPDIPALALVRSYLAAYAVRDLAAIPPLFAERIVLRDGKVRVVGRGDDEAC